MASCQSCDVSCLACSDTSSNCTECPEGQTLNTSTRSCGTEKLGYKAEYQRITKRIKVNFDYGIVLKGTGSDFKVQFQKKRMLQDTQEEESSINISSVSKTGTREISFLLAIEGNPIDTMVFIYPSSEKFDPLLIESSMEPVTDYPIQLEVNSQKSTKLDDFLIESEPYSSSSIQVAAFLGLFFNPMVVVYMFKFLQILDYIELLNIDTPQNARNFLASISQEPLNSIPKVFKEPPSDAKSDCKLHTIVIQAGFSCSPFVNLYKYIYLFSAFLTLIFIKFLICYFLRRKASSEVKKQKAKTVLEAVAGYASYLFSLNFFIQIFFIFQADFIVAFSISVFSGSLIEPLDILAIVFGSIFCLSYIAMTLMLFIVNIAPKLIKKLEKASKWVDSNLF